MGHGPPRVPRRDLPVEGTLTIDVYADVHVGARGFLEKRFLKDLKESLTNEGRYVVLNGDLFNSEMRDAKHGGIYEEVKTLDECLDWWQEALEGHQDKLLAVIGGNHDRRAWDRAGIDPVRQLVSRLRIADRYMKDGGYVSTSHGVAADSRQRDGSPRPLVYRGFYSHGTGSTPNSTNAQRVTDGFDADYYALGHTHTPLVTSGLRFKLNPQTDTVCESRWVLGVGGSYLEYDGYALERRYRPRPNGRLSFHLDGRERHVGITCP